MAGLLPPVRDIGVLRDPVRSFLALFALFVLLLLFFGLLERLGLQAAYVPEAVLVSAAALFGLVALFAHGRRPVDFYVADRSVRPALGGAAAASSIVGLLTIGLASGVFRSAYDMLISAAGFLLGALLLAIVAPGLRLAGGTHFGDFLAARFGVAARLAGAAVALAASFLLLTAVVKSAGPLVSALIGFTPEQGLSVAAALCAMTVIPGGMRSLTWTQAAQYLVTILACLAPLVMLFFGEDGRAARLDAESLQTGLAELLQSFEAGRAVEVAPPVILLAIGTASLPQVLARLYPAPTGRAAAASMLWCFLAATLLIGLGLLFGQALVAPSNLISSPDLSGDVLTRAMPLLVALPPMFIGLVMAGLLSTLLAAGQAALFSATTALSRDIWDEIIDRRGPAGRRILVARLLTIGLAYLAARADWPVQAPALLGWALAAAAAGNFVPLILGLAWPGCTRLGAATGIAAGFGLVAGVFLLDLGFVPAWEVTGPAARIGSMPAAALGMAGALLVSVAVSLLVPESEAGEATGARRRVEAPPGRERPA